MVPLALGYGQIIVIIVAIIFLFAIFRLIWVTTERFKK